jgi:nucleotide-binding universal stress UspA family protein
VAAAVPLAVAATDPTARDLMCEAVDRVPGDVSVTTIVTALPIRAALTGQLAQGHHDLVMLGARPCGRLRSLLGNLSHWLVRHSPAPVLVVHAEPEPTIVTPRPAGAQVRSRLRASTRSPVT